MIGESGCSGEVTGTSSEGRDRTIDPKKSSLEGFGERVLFDSVSVTVSAERCGIEFDTNKAASSSPPSPPLPKGLV